MHLGGRMRVTLVYNARSGGAAPEADIVAELHGAGGTSSAGSPATGP
jgi:hypothetical protein